MHIICFMKKKAFGNTTREGHDVQIYFSFKKL